MENKLDQMIEMLEAARADYEKFYTKGVKAAATRLRKQVESVARECKILKKDVLEKKKIL